MENLLLILFLILQVFCFLSFWFGHLKIFRYEAARVKKRERFFLQVSTILIWNLTPLFIFLNYSVRIDLFFLTLAIILSLSALLLFWISARTIQDKEFAVVSTQKDPFHLVQNGPYQYIRHPFYSSYLMSYLASGLVIQHIMIWMPVFYLFFYYYKSARNEELGFLRSSLCDGYNQYQKRTGMFFPRVKIFR